MFTRVNAPAHEFVSVSKSILPNALFQIIAGGPLYRAEYVIVEANCTDDGCVPLIDAMAVSTHKAHCF